MPTVNKNQIIVSGDSLGLEQATEVRAWCQRNEFFATDWCHPDGTIGYIDIANREVDNKGMREQLQKIALEFVILELGVSVMSGPPGHYNVPLFGFKVSKGRVTNCVMPHSGHKAPRRWKKQEVETNMSVLVEPNQRKNKKDNS